MELATFGGNVLVADIQVSGQGVGVQDSVSTTQSKSSSQRCEDATGSVRVVPPFGCSKEILLTDCSWTCSDPDVLCLPIMKENNTTVFPETNIMINIMNIIKCSLHKSPFLSCTQLESHEAAQVSITEPLEQY